MIMGVKAHFGVQVISVAESASNEHIIMSSVSLIAMFGHAKSTAKNLSPGLENKHPN